MNKGEKSEHCCEDMVTSLKDAEVQIFYDKHLRNYYITLLDQKGIVAKQSIAYCPWCAVRLPKNLHDEYYEILENEHKLDFHDISDGNIPEEFKSDEWWRKRRL